MPTYYVATTGNDAGAGTIGDPWATFNHAWATVAAGDTVYLRAGTYTLTEALEAHSHNVKGSSESERTTFRNYPGETVVIDQAAGYKWLALDTDTYPVDTGKGYCTFQGLTFTNGTSYGLELWGNHWIIQDCVFVDIPDDNIKCHMPGGLIDGCEFYRTTTDPTDTANAIDKADYEVGPTISNCYFHDFYTADQIVLLKGGCQNAKVYNNLFVDCGGSGDHDKGVITVGGWTDPAYLGSSLYENRDCQVYNNVIIGGGKQAILVVSAQNPIIANNTVIGPTGRYVVGVRKVTATPGVNADGDPILASTNVRLLNNVFYSGGGAAYKALVYVEADCTTDLDIDHNSWFVDAPANLLFLWGGGYSDYASAVSFADWKAASGQDANSIVTDPDTGATGLLNVGSPCINAGTAWTGIPATDYSGDARVQGASVDIGAYEYTEATSVGLLVRIL